MNSLFFKSLLISFFLVPIVKAGSGTKFDWVKDLKDVEHYHSDDYVDYEHNTGKEVYVPVYKSWPHWTNFLRSKAKREDKWSQKQSNYEEYEPSLFIKNEFEAFSKYLWDVSNLCGRLPTKKELILLSSGKPTPDLKCSEVPLLNGLPLSESKHWYETLNEPDLIYLIQTKEYAKVFFTEVNSKNEWSFEVPSNFSEKKKLSQEQQIKALLEEKFLKLNPIRISYYEVETLIMTFRILPFIWDENADFYSHLSSYYVFKGTHATNGNNDFNRSQIGSISNILYTLCPAHNLVKIFDGKEVKDKSNCYLADQLIFPYKKYFSKKNLKKNENGNYVYDFESLKKDPNPMIHFREIYKKKHGNPKPPKKKVLKKWSPPMR